DVAGKRTDEDFIQAMVEKRDVGALPDVVSLRDLRTMIRIAAEEAETDEEAEQIKSAIENVISDPAATIEEAYDDTVGTRVAAETYGRSVERFQRSTEHVVRQVQEAKSSVSDLAERLEKLGRYLIDLAERLRSTNGA